MKFHTTIFLCALSALLGGASGYRLAVPVSAAPDLSLTAGAPGEGASTTQILVGAKETSKRGSDVELPNASPPKHLPLKTPSEFLAELPAFEKQNVQAMLNTLPNAYQVTSVDQYAWLLAQGFPSLEDVQEASQLSVQQLYDVMAKTSNGSVERRKACSLHFMRAMQELERIADPDERRQAFERTAETSYVHLTTTGTPALVGYAMLQVERVVPGFWPHLPEVGRAMVMHGGDGRLINMRRERKNIDDNVEVALSNFSSTLAHSKPIEGSLPFPK